MFYFNCRLPLLGRYSSGRSRGSASRCWGILWKTLEAVIIHSWCFFYPWKRKGNSLIFFILQVGYLQTSLLVVFMMCLWIGVNWYGQITNLLKSANSALFQTICVLRIRDKLKLQVLKPSKCGWGFEVLSWTLHLDLPSHRAESKVNLVEVCIRALLCILPLICSLHRYCCIVYFLFSSFLIIVLIVLTVDSPSSDQL